MVPSTEVSDIPPANAEVIPGVLWGRPEWVPSPAFWLALLRSIDGHDAYISPPETPLEEVLVFCLLGGYGITAEMNHAAFERLVEVGFFEAPRQYSVAGIEYLLSFPLLVDGHSRRYRFPRQRAERIAAAIDVVLDQPPPRDNVVEFRRQLMELKGIGPKTASWIARNWIGTDDVAILDIHVIRACQKMGVFGSKVILPRDYESLERRFLDFARALGVRASLLDAVIWREMRLLLRK